jgi:CheY-like chemotaxis protein
MGGAVAVERSPHGGARFQFTLSLPACGPELREAATAIVAPTPHETLHVLVADDNPTNRFVAGRLLEIFGCTHEMVQDGAEALKAASTRPFDLILMDIKMPVMDGVAATRAIRALPGPAGRIPILALTANVDARDEAEYVAAGMNGVAQKPIQPDALLNAIRLALGAGPVAAAA